MLQTEWANPRYTGVCAHGNTPRIAGTEQANLRRTGTCVHENTPRRIAKYGYAADGASKPKTHRRVCAWEHTHTPSSPFCGGDSRKHLFWILIHYCNKNHTLLAHEFTSEMVVICSHSSRGFQGTVNHECLQVDVTERGKAEEICKHTRKFLSENVLVSSVSPIISTLPRCTKLNIWY